MASTEWIESAANPRKPPVGGVYLSLESPLLSMPARERTAEQQRIREQKDRRDRRKAGEVLSGALLDHPCELDPEGGFTECGHHDHDRDAEDVREMLEALGLVGYRSKVKPETTEPTCTRCGVSQPVDQFVHPVGITIRRTHQCLGCREKYNPRRAPDEEAGR